MPSPYLAQCPICEQETYDLEMHLHKHHSIDIDATPDEEAFTCKGCGEVLVYVQGHLEENPQCVLKSKIIG